MLIPIMFLVYASVFLLGAGAEVSKKDPRFPSFIVNLAFGVMALVMAMKTA